MIFKDVIHTPCIYINKWDDKFDASNTSSVLNIELMFLLLFQQWHSVYLALFTAGASWHPFSPNVPTLLRVEIYSISLIPPFLDCFLTIYCVLAASLCSDIFKPCPWGEQKSASIWNQLFHSVHESRTKPGQKETCKDRGAICFYHGCRLSCYQRIYCASMLQPRMWRGAWSFAAHQSCHNMEWDRGVQMAR